MKLASRGDPHFPHRALVGPECELAQARQAGRIPHGSKVPCDARQDPATESRTVHFVIPNQDRAQKVATQNMTHNWQLYILFLMANRCWDPTVSVRVQAHQSTSVSKHSWSRSIWTQKKFICLDSGLAPVTQTRKSTIMLNLSQSLVNARGLSCNAHGPRCSAL